MFRVTLAGNVGTVGAYQSEDRIFVRLRVAVNIGAEPIWLTIFKNNFTSVEAAQRFCAALSKGAQITIVGRLTRIDEDGLTCTADEIVLPPMAQSSAPETENTPNASDVPTKPKATKIA